MRNYQRNTEAVSIYRPLFESIIWELAEPVNVSQGCTEMKFKDRLRLYKVIGQLLRRDLAFVTSITKRQIVSRRSAARLFFDFRFRFRSVTLVGISFTYHWINMGLLDSIALW